MEQYKEASKLKLRFETSKGLLTAEQLWDMSLQELDKVAVSLKRKKNAKSESFLEIESPEDKVAGLKFDIALDILKTKVEEDAAARNAVADKEHNQKILGILAKKKEDALEKMTEEQLEALLK